MPNSLERLLSVVAVLVCAGPAVADSGAPVCSESAPTMLAARALAAGGPEVLRIERIPVPAVGPGQVLVRVHYASINPVDWKLQQAGRLPFPATPGGDFAGEVVRVGEGVTEVQCGAHVAGIVDQRTGGGSYAEFVVVPVSEIVPKPAAFTMAEASAYPTVAVAAWRYLVQAAAVKQGERVLVHGGAGGVGSMAVQIAKAKGAYVIATASARNHEYLRQIGADETIDYRAVRFEEVVRDVDIVVDTVGGDTVARSATVLREGGRLVTLVGSVPRELCASGRIACPATPPWNVKQGLEAVAPLIAAGKLRVNIDATYPLEAVAKAQEHNRAGSTRGKVVLDMAANE